MSNERIKSVFKKINTALPSLCLSLLSGWLATLFIFNIQKGKKFTAVPDYAKSVNILLLIGIMLLLTVLIFAAGRFISKKIITLALPLSFTLYGISAVAKSSANDSDTRAYTAIGFILLTLAVIAIVANYLKREKITLFSTDISPLLSFLIVSAGFVALSAYFIFVLGSRTAVLCSPCYDMGIFAQMYDNMTETGLPYTTCERGEYLSHFAVHFSPVLYLLLPFCYIFKATDVLVWAQILVVFSGVFPLLLICRRIKLSNLKSTLICLVYLLYPAMSSGAFYDFHENAFLAPLILWTFFFIHAEKWIPTFIFALGVLTVKEDAAMYVGFIALYVIFSRKKIWQGILLFVMTFCYFLFAMFMLLESGEGIMLGGRYYNIIGYDGSFVDLLRVALVNPALYAAESFTSAKLLYALNMLLPLAFLPLMTRKPSRWLLIAPLFVINLITDYEYQFNLQFQYSFGSGAFLVYAAAINLADMSSSPFEACAESEELAELPEGEASNEAATSKIPSHSFKKFAAGLSAALVVISLVSSLFLGAARAPSQFLYAKRYEKEKQDVAIAKEVLESIDRDKSVMATSMYLTYLYDVDELYHSSHALKEIKAAATGEAARYDLLIETDVAVLDLRKYVSDASKAELWKKAYIKAGYEVVAEHEGIILVLEKQ